MTALIHIIESVIALAIGRPLSLLIRLRWRHIRTRSSAPQTGDRWTDGGLAVDIMHVSADGRVACRFASGWGSWSDSPDEWRLRVRNRKLWRVTP